MNTTQAKTRLLMLCKVLAEESQQWPEGRQRAKLMHGSFQLAYLARSIRPSAIELPSEEVVTAYLTSAIDMVAAHAAARAFGMKVPS